MVAYHDGFPYWDEVNKMKWMEGVNLMVWSFLVLIFFSSVKYRNT